MCRVADATNSPRLSFRASTTNRAISCIEFGGRVRLRPRWQRGRVHRRPLESSSLMMLTRRARRSGVDQAVVRVADPPAEQEGLRVPAGRPPASHGRSMSCDSLWSLARSQRCSQRHLVDTAYRSPLKDPPERSPPYQTCHRRSQRWIEEGSRWRTRSSGRRSRREER